MQQRWSREALCYCSNVHYSETEADLYDVISHYHSGVRKKRQLNQMASGLWINHKISQQLLANPEKIQAFKAFLSQKGVKLCTLNGFPYDNFHADVVKEQVYLPDWSDPARYQYSINLAQILAECLPEEEGEGTISTLPLGFKHNWTEKQQDKALDALCRIAKQLAGLFKQTGKSIRLCLEMEPDCVLESTFEVLDLFQKQLPNKAAQLGIEKNTLKQHLGLCFDVCHQAVMFENIPEVLDQLVKAEITIGKIQISSALEIKKPDQQRSKNLLAEFAEPKYLHQVRTQHQGELIRSLDLALALTQENFPTTSAWRIHYHLPIQVSSLPQQEMNTTQQSILEVLDFLQTHPDFHPHLEVETYTWNVLPSSIRPHDKLSLINGLAEELNWLEQQMQNRELLTTHGKT